MIALQGECWKQNVPRFEGLDDPPPVQHFAVLVAAEQKPLLDIDVGQHPLPCAPRRAAEREGPSDHSIERTEGANRRADTDHRPVLTIRHRANSFLPLTTPQFVWILHGGCKKHELRHWIKQIGSPLHMQQIIG